MTLTIKSNSSRKMPDNLKLFLARFPGSIQHEFHRPLSVEFKENANRTNQENKKIETRPPKEFTEYISKIQSQSDSDFMNSLDFHRNYSLILSNIFGKEEDKKRLFSKSILGIFKSHLKEYILRKLKTKKNFENNVSEILLSLFLLHLRIPEVLLNQLSPQKKITVLLVIFFFLFELKEISPYVDTIPDNLFRNNTLFDIKLSPDLTTLNKKLVYFCFWFLQHVLKSFSRLRFGLCSNKSTSKKIRQITSLFNFPDVRIDHSVLGQPLSKLVQSVDINLTQHLFIFLQSRYYYKENEELRLTREKKKRVYFYKSEQSTAKRFVIIKPKVLNFNPLRKLNLTPNNISVPLRKLKRHQEVSIFIGPRIKNFFVDKLFEEVNDRADKRYIFTISGAEYDKLARDFPSKSESIQGSIPSLERLNAALNQKLLTSYKIPIYLLKTIMCTDQYEKYSKEFLSLRFVQNEIVSVFSRQTVLSKARSSSETISFLIRQKSKIKFPWAVVELLNSVSFTESLEKKIDLENLCKK